MRLYFGRLFWGLGMILGIFAATNADKLPRYCAVVSLIMCIGLLFISTLDEW